MVDVAGILYKTAFVKNSALLDIDEKETPEQMKNIVSQVNDFGGSLVEMVSNNYVSKKIEESEFTWRFIKNNPNSNAAVSLIEENFSKALQQIGTETFTIWGEPDNVAPLRTAKILEQHLQNATLSAIAGAEHVPMETHNELFLALLEKSLNGAITKKQIDEPLENKGDLICDDLNNQRYSGSYNKVHISNCSNVQLVNFYAK